MIAINDIRVLTNIGEENKIRLINALVSECVKEVIEPRMLSMAKTGIDKCEIYIPVVMNFFESKSEDKTSKYTLHYGDLRVSYVRLKYALFNHIKEFGYKVSGDGDFFEISWAE